MLTFLLQTWLPEFDSDSVLALDRRPPLRPDGPGPGRRLEHVGGNLPARRGTASIRPPKEAQRSTGQVSIRG